jgi:hypothetical protein
MSYLEQMSLAFHMDPIQHRAMVLEHPGVFRNFRAPQVICGDPFDCFAYHGEGYWIAELLSLVRNWQHRPASEEELRNILGEGFADAV